MNYFHTALSYMTRAYLFFESHETVPMIPTDLLLSKCLYYTSRVSDALFSFRRCLSRFKTASLSDKLFLSATIGFTLALYSSPNSRSQANDIVEKLMRFITQLRVKDE